MLTPNQTATLSVLFAPTGAGPDSGSVSITSSAANSPQAISLSGTAVAQQHSVTLNWEASGSSDVVGYNVYRGTTSGVYTLINTSLVAPTSYTDSSVESGQNITYYYVVTAVASSGEESTNSNQAAAVVP
jgi:fibronectin type 3 domain-containing protein